MLGLNPNDKTVLSTLERSGRPLSAYDILDRARTDALKAPVQVYRALQKLEQRGLVHRIEALNAFVACCSGHQQGLHRPAFVVCTACSSVREFEDRRVGEIAAAAAGQTFEVDLVSLEIFGQCGDCRNAASEKRSGDDSGIEKPTQGAQKQ